MFVVELKSSFGVLFVWLQDLKKKKKKTKRCGSADCGFSNRSGEEDVSGDIARQTNKPGDKS